MKRKKLDSKDNIQNAGSTLPPLIDDQDEYNTQPRKKVKFEHSKEKVLSSKESDSNQKQHRIDKVITENINYILSRLFIEDGIKNIEPNIKIKIQKFLDVAVKPIGVEKYSKLNKDNSQLFLEVIEKSLEQQDSKKKFSHVLGVWKNNLDELSFISNENKNLVGNINYVLCQIINRQTMIMYESIKQAREATLSPKAWQMKINNLINGTTEDITKALNEIAKGNTNTENHIVKLELSISDHDQQSQIDEVQATGQETNH